MGEIMESKFLSNRKMPRSKSKFMVRIINSSLICLLLFIIVLIGTKASPNFKKFIEDKIFSQNFQFAKINNWYQKYLGGIIPFKDVFKDNTVTVFNEKISYNDSKNYKDGCVLSVDEDYLVPVLESGLVVFIGEKEGYGKTVIIQQVDGVDVWYSNVENINIKLYDYIEKGSALGNVIDNKLYLVYQKDGKMLDYKEHL